MRWSSFLFSFLIIFQCGTAETHYTLLYNTSCVTPIPPTPPPTPPPSGDYVCCYYFSHSEKFESAFCQLGGDDCPVISPFLSISFSLLSPPFPLRFPSLSPPFPLSLLFSSSPSLTNANADDIQLHAGLQQINEQL